MYLYVRVTLCQCIYAFVYLCASVSVYLCSYIPVYNPYLLFDDCAFNNFYTDRIFLFPGEQLTVGRHVQLTDHLLISRAVNASVATS